jgi:hypothetical protein
MEVIADIGLVVPEGVTHIQIDYCISWGYKNNFVQLKQWIEAQNP